ncbi:MAG: peptide chain release factor N(5)-glutamine methyltransferase, partial [Candidatus Latescibacteria bacterium]|nr:peptide chain release factor N(5)-glutamine methyltransferase [Candidatus Latescibacterota bacterium]
MTIGNLLQHATTLLFNAGCSSPDIDAERLLCHTLGLSRVDLYLNTSRPLTPDEIQQCEMPLHLRVTRLPLQYILRETEFMSLPFSVNPSVLIPRPETEVLVETVIDRLRRLAPPHPTVADIGTGSGVIAVALAHFLPQTVVYATDTSDIALRIARLNTKRNGVIDRVFFLKGDVTAPLTCQLDALVSNPPYIPTDDISKLPLEVRDHEPRQALDGGPDGLRYYRRLVPEATNLLKNGGILGLEVGGEGQAKAVGEMIEKTARFQ